MQVREQIDSVENTLKTLELYLVSSGSARLVKWYNTCLVSMSREFDSHTEHHF
jgi:hypothetical protein